MWMQVLLCVAVVQQSLISCNGNPVMGRSRHFRPNRTPEHTRSSQHSSDKISFRPLPFPVNFRFYDINHDGHVDIRELLSVTGEAENVQQAFQSSDLNGDGLVSRREYRRVPWGYNKRHDVIMPDNRA